MIFNEILKEIMEKHGLIAADLHKRCDLKRPYISKMLAGDLIPSSFSIIESIADAIGLTLEEKIRLSDAYQYTKSSDESKLLWHSFKTAYALEYKSVKDAATSAAELPSNGTMLIEKQKVLDVIARLMTDGAEEICLYFGALGQQIIDDLFGIFDRASISSELKWILPLNNTDKTDTQNFSMITNIMKLLCCRRTRIMKLMGDTDIMLGSTIFPFFLISDGRLAVFDTDLENAVYFNSADIVSYYMHRFYDMLSRSDYLGDSFDSGFDAMQFLSSCFSGFGNKKYDYYILANVPCIVNDVSHNTILKYANETDGKEGLGAKFGEIINAISNISETTTDIFSYYGMVDYLDLDEWYEYGKHLSKSIDKQLRRDMLDHLLYFSEDERSLNSLMLRLPGFNTNSLVGINFWTNGLIVILYDFPEKPVVIVLNDKSMVASYISYINEMKKCELISTKERSAELIMEELNKRK